MLNSLASMFEILPTGDVKSWAFRLIHLGLIGAAVALAMIMLLVLQNAYLIYSARKRRLEMCHLNNRLKRLLELR